MPAIDYHETAGNKQAHFKKFKQEKAFNRIIQNALKLLELKDDLAQPGQTGELSPAHLEGISETLENIADEIMISVGTFRFEVHRLTQEVLETISAYESFKRLNRELMEESMLAALEEYDLIELIYATDANGIQITSNMHYGEFVAAYGSSGIGMDWSRRAWFKETAASGITYISDIYKSRATERFCFTIATPIRGIGGEMIGVLAGDVDYSKMIT